MRLYLVQHGEATTKEVDPDRPLTEKGREDSAKTARFLKEAGTNIDVIWHSAKNRARETAYIFADELLPKNDIREKEGLAPEDPVDKIFKEITKTNKDLMIVGHLPFLQKLASLALAGSESREVARFKMGGAVCLGRNNVDGTWRVMSEVLPEQLK